MVSGTAKDLVIRSEIEFVDAIEYGGGTRTQAFATIEERIRANITEVLDRAAATAGVPVDAAQDMAQARVRRAMSTRRWT